MSYTLSDLNQLPAEQKELLLDLGQVVLDVVGIFEPTPFADASNALISLWRGDWTGAGLSAAGIIPYLGDAGKLGKLPKYLESVNKALIIAAKDNRFATMVRPILKKLYEVLDRIPSSFLPLYLGEQLNLLRSRLSNALPSVFHMTGRLNAMTDEMLRLVLGSTQNVGRLPRQNMQTIVQFFDRYKVGNGDLKKWAELVKGIDLHAVQPVSIERFRAGDLVAEYVELARPADRQIGQWMVKVQGAVSANNLGLSGEGRIRKVYQIRQDVEVLASRAAGAADHWTMTGTKPHTAIVYENGRKVLKDAMQVAGQGEQFFLPDAWNFLDEL